MPFQITDKKNRPCQHMVAPLTFNRIQQLSAVLQTKWDIVGSKMLRQVFEFSSFMESMLFVNDVAAIAEEMDHHPDVLISCGTVTVELSTHAIGALSEKDFVLAKRIEYVK